MNQEPNPQDNPVTPDPEDKATEPEPTPTPPWWQDGGLSFNDEATAIESARHAQSKITKLSRENREFERAQAQADQQPQAQPPEPKVSAESFFEDPASAMAAASEQGARKVFQEFRQQQDNERMIDKAATENNVDRDELENMYHELNNNPEKAVQYLAAIAAAQKGQVQAQDVRTAMNEVAETKSRATGTTAGSHVPVDTEPDWDNMSYEDALKEMIKRGMMAPPRDVL